jgi:TatD DNase family protein
LADRLTPPRRAAVLIDAHAHLDRYGDDLDAALSEIESKRILTFTVSMDIPSWERNREIAERSPLVVPAFGVHPWNAAEYVTRLDEAAAAASQAPMIGEIGLDHFFVEDESAYPAQREVFASLLAAAAERDKIVNLHTKGAEGDVLDMVEASGVRRVIVHWYSGPSGPLRGFIERGALLTVGPEIARSEDARRIAREIPEHLLLTETDNPGGLEWLTGTPGMPGAVEDVVRTLAEIRGDAPAETARTVERNLVRLIEGDRGLAGALRALGRGVPTDATGAVYGGNGGAS